MGSLSPVAHRELLAKQSGIRFSRRRTVAQELCDAILPAAKPLQGEIDYLPAENIIRVIGGRILGLAAALGLKADVDVLLIDTAPA